MSKIALRRMRIWLVILTTTTLLLMTAQYTYAAIRLKSYLSLDWEDWVVIPSVPILSFSYLYALKSTRPPKLHKFLRAFFMLIPTVLNMYVNFDYLATYLRLSSMDYNPRFQCGGSPACLLTWSLVFMSIIMDFFVLCEIVMTLVWGPLVEKVHLFGGFGGGYAQDTNVIVVSPDQSQQAQSQQGYYGQQPVLQQQQQQQAYYPAMQQQEPILQQPLPQQQQLYHQFVPLDLNPQFQQPLFQQQLQQQLYHYPAVSGVPTTTTSMPYLTASYSQSSVASPVGYQSPPQQVASSNPQYNPPYSTPQ